MKKLLSFLLVLALLLMSAACAAAPTKNDALRIYSLKGATSMGLVKLLQDNDAGSTENQYSSSIVTAAEEVTAALVNADTDIAMLPANAAATLFNKAGGFSVVAVNTLGVLSLIENGQAVQTLDDLAGKTVVLTGKGTTPEYALRTLLAAHGIEQSVTLEFKSEAAEVVSALTQSVAAVGLLPQPYAASALMQNENLHIALRLSDEWSVLGADSTLVTGVTVVRNELLTEKPEQIAAFLEEYAASIAYVNEHPAEAAQLIEQRGIVAKAAIAEKALPECNLTYLAGEQMKTALSGYLQTLYDQNPDAVGGKLPADDFYYLP